MTQIETKLDIEQLNQRHVQERLLISSGAIFQTIFNSLEPISTVAIAMELDLSVAMVRNAIAHLSKDKLIEQDYQGNWEVAF